jgi:hypothetical protein
MIFIEPVCLSGLLNTIGALFATGFGKISKMFPEAIRRSAPDILPQVLSCKVVFLQINENE